MTTRDIGERLCLSTKSVETHRVHVREKRRLNTGLALIKHAVRWAGARESI
jgi:DNA-binding CsgD family transcriptional regulator